MVRAVAVLGVLVAMVVGCASMNGSADRSGSSAAAGHSPLSRGKYLVMIGGCNDCHTPEFERKGMAVPEDQWLVGVPVGFKGPWGTTYPTNLRRFTSQFNEDLFVQVIRQRNARPPMPWTSLHAMTDADLREVYRYIHSLPIKGDPTPEFVPPGQEPKTPYIVFEPQPPRT